MRQVILLVGCVVMCQGLVWADPPANYEGFGATITGAIAAPGGYTTYHVTKLTDDGSEGTLRDALSQGSRLIVFDIGGTITLTSNLFIRYGYITIDGSTAPNPGITIAMDKPNYYFSFCPNAGDVSDIIVKYIRIDGQSPTHWDSGGGDLLGLAGGQNQIDGVIYDHITATASGDGIFDVTGDVLNVTISNCFLYNSQVFMIINATDRITLHNNVFTGANGRHPLLKGELTNFNFVNNVIYGWGGYGAGSQGLRITNDEGAGYDPDAEIIKNVFHYVSYPDSYPYRAILVDGNGDIGNVTFTGNLFPPEETEDVSYGTPTVIPLAYRPHEHEANTLGDTVVPYVGIQYPTDEEIALLDEISLAIGGQGYVQDPNNLPPVLQAIGDKSVDENATLTFDVNATDPNNEPLTYLAQSLPSGATLDSQTGDFAWTPSYTQAGSYSVTFRASDGNSSDSETITITVSNVNRPPVLGAISDPSVDENDLLTISVSATDPDGQALTYSVSGLPNGAVFASQTFTWTPAYDQAGTFAVTFTADDGQAQDFQVVTITVINVNRAPVFSAIDNKSVWSDDPLTFTVNATDPDGEAVTYSASAIPSGSTFTTQTFDWTPAPAQIGSYNVIFYASDGQLQDSEAITITVNVDSLAPTVTNLSPAAGAIQVPLNNLITLNVTDAGKGINADSVKIKVRINSNPNNDTVYFGDMDHYISLLGDCRRVGSIANYTFVFQPTQDLLYYDQTVTITVNATDLAGNVMDSYIYLFVTEMHLFGQNKLVSTNSYNNNRPVTVCDSSGNIWAAWHTGSAGSRDIYIGMLAAGADNFGSTIQITNDETDQCNPALALDSNDKLYAVWQDNREGDWDIYISTSVDGINWFTETRVNDPNNGNQVNPAIVIDSQLPNYAYVVWQDDRAGNQDICIAASSDGFITKTVSQITSNTSDQVKPAIAADSANTIYVVWTDGRNGSSDIYGAASNNGPWTNVAIVSNASDQSSPVIAAESTGSILHLLWVDDTQGDNDIYYAASDGLPGSPLTGSSIIDELGSNQLDPTIVITGTTANNDLKVFACWQDWRNTDTDLYFVELNAGSGTNVFVNDGGSYAYQGEPAIGINEYGYPYLIWADDRNTNTDIYYTGSTFIEPVALASALVSASAPGSTIIGVDPQAITDVDDVSIVFPAGACLYDVDISIVTILNQQVFSTPCYGSYDFGPSGIQFNQPVTITIPYVYASSNGSTVPYWFNSLTGTLSQQGITNIRDIVISPTLHAISFETMHFTPFYLLGGDAAVALSGGGGGGGCSVSASNEGNIVEFVLPYIVLFVVMAILKKRDARYHNIRIT